MSQGYRRHQSEGRGRKNHHRDQPRRRSRHRRPHRLLVDCDPQGNATSGVGLKVKRPPAAPSTKRSPATPPTLDAAAIFIVPTAIDRLSLIPATRDLSGAEIELIGVPDRERRLESLLEPLRDRVRLHHHRLASLARPADAQRARRRRPRADPAALRVLRARRPRRPRLDDAARARRAQPGARHRRRVADDERRAHQPRAAGRARRPRVLQGQGVPHRDSAQRASRRGAKPRHAGRDLRPEIARRRAYFALADELLERNEPRSPNDLQARERPWKNDQHSAKA